MCKNKDTRIPLCEHSIVQFDSENRFIITKYISGGELSLTYLAHRMNSNAYVVLKELFPRASGSAIAVRGHEGRIILQDSVIPQEETDYTEMWSKLQTSFQKEASFTRKAGSVYSAASAEKQRNRSDVLKVEGPVQDTCGNTYLIMDVRQGELLRDYIDRGFIRASDGRVLSNQNISGVLDVLLNTAQRLSTLHENARMYHLGLSCDNIYLIKSTDGSALHPHIIDYSSVYCVGSTNDDFGHQFNCNPHSAPEVLAMAKSQSGYTPDRSSDTYSMASILFYAATGKIFTPDMRMFNAEWKEQLRREYSANIPGVSSDDSFSSALISFLKKGLAASQDERYISTEDFIKSLRQLRKKYREYDYPLPLLSSDERMSYLVLEKHPLYNYRSEDGSLHVVCFGCGKFIKQMVLTLLSTGQMADCHLNIHIVSNEPASVFTQFLKTAAPELPNYSNLEWEATDNRIPFLYDSIDEANKARECYVSFTYDCVEDVTEKDAAREVLAKYPDTRYFIVSLGQNHANVTAVKLLAELLRTRNEHTGNSIINYYSAADDGKDMEALQLDSALPAWLEIGAFSDTLSEYSSAIQSLGQLTLKLAHLYDKLGNPRISMAESARRLAEDEYSQRSSCASALHLKYKLASIGINPAPSTNIRTMISAYQKAIASGKAGVLMELEHRRWLMYMVASGYRAPTSKELVQYGFETVNGSFNGRWRCDAKRLHPCIVPSSTAGTSIQESDWGRFASRREVKESGFDPLDQASLIMHNLARRKCEDILADGTFEILFRRMDRKLNDAQEEAAAENQVDISVRYASARQLLLDVRTTVCDRTGRLEHPGNGELLAELYQEFEALGINISGEILEIKQHLSVFAEYSANKDYKEPDASFIRNLPWLLFSRNDLPLIKLKGSTIADNITGPVVLEPNTIVYFGTEQNQRWVDFLRNHGFRGEAEFIPYCGTTVAEIEHSLYDVAAQYRKRCVIDVTGSDELMVVAATKLASKYEGISLIRSTPEGEVENIRGFTAAPAYAFRSVITADEVFALYGARKNEAEESQYMARLGELVPVLWELYQEFRESWGAVTAFAADSMAAEAGTWVNGIQLNDHTEWRPFNRDTIAMNHWNQLHLTEVFEKLRDAGIIRELSIENRASKAVVSFLCPVMSSEPKTDYLLKSLNIFFDRKVPVAYTPFNCRVRFRENTGFAIDIKTSCMVDCSPKKPDFSDQQIQRAGGEKMYPFALLEKPLKRMEELGLISNLELSLSNESYGNFIRYVYTNPAIKDCLMKAGNILELYVWNEARKTGVFDDCSANFKFTWEEGVENELDVVLTHGLDALAISCKTAKFNKEHLYEIKYLTERFSLNSKPVIVYSSTMAFENGRLTKDLQPVKNRAKAMGVYLIDLNSLECGLGEKLVRIANGLDLP